jgi:hypothetical protein
MTLAAILGGARCVWEDLEALTALRAPDFIIATNDAGAHYAGRVDHWATLHYEKLPTWTAERALRGYPPAERIWVHTKAVGPVAGNSLHDRLEDWGGSSGLFAVQVALALGAARVALCGVPLEVNEGHFFDPGRWSWAVRYRSGWINHRAEIAGPVRSMSGWTAEYLGKPDEVWLHEKEQADGLEGST